MPRRKIPAKEHPLLYDAYLRGNSVADLCRQFQALPQAIDAALGELLGERKHEAAKEQLRRSIDACRARIKWLYDCIEKHQEGWEEKQSEIKTDENGITVYKKGKVIQRRDMRLAGYYLDLIRREEELLARLQGILEVNADDTLQDITPRYNPESTGARLLAGLPDPGDCETDEPE